MVQKHMKNDTSKINFYEYANVEIVSGYCEHSFPLHIHEIPCFGAITGGTAEFINGRERIVIPTGGSYFIPPYTPHTLSAIKSQKFGYVVFCFKKYRVQNLMNPLAEKIKNYIEQTQEKLSLESLSKEMHISKYHLDRIFKEQTGITPYQFYLHDRIKKIRQGLHSLSSLPDLALALDFSDQSHLCNTFKKHMGITPTQYIKSYFCG